MANELIFDCKQLDNFSERLQKLSDETIDAMLYQVTNELTSSIQGLVMKRTPMGENTTHLRHSWRYDEPKKIGNTWTTTIYNTLPYALWVEMWHMQHKRFVSGYFDPKKGGKFIYDPHAQGGITLKEKWVEAKFMLSTTINEVTPKVVNKSLCLFYYYNQVKERFF